MGVGVDLASLTPEQLWFYAAGYTDALADTEPERAQLVETATKAVAELELERVRADQIYHDAYCSCRQHLIQRILTADRIRAARKEQEPG